MFDIFINFDYDENTPYIKGYLWHIDEPVSVMCVIHGVGEHAGRYDKMATFLNDNGIAVVSMDHRGHGLSKGKRGHAAPRVEVLKDVDCMIQYAVKKYPGIPLILYGHSLGGNICLHYRAEGNFNDVPSKYIISAPWLKLVKPVSKGLYHTVKLMSKICPSLGINHGCKAEDLGNEEMIKNYKSDELLTSKVSLLTAFEGFEIANALLNGSEKNNGRAENIPTMLMHGTEDKICDIEGSRTFARRYEANKNFLYLEWPGYYHEIHNGGKEANGEKVLEAIKDYILY